MLYLFQSESDYEHWQLLDEPVSYESYCSLPLLTGMFFEYSLRLDPDLELPVVIFDQCEINVWAWEPIKYKYKFFPVNRVSVVENQCYLLQSRNSIRMASSRLSSAAICTVLHALYMDGTDGEANSDQLIPYL